MVVILLSVFRSALMARLIGAGWVKKAGLMTYPLYLNHYTLGMCLTPFLAMYIQNDALLLVTVSAIIMGSAWAIMTGPEIWLQDAARRAFLAGNRSVTVPMPTERQARNTR